MNREILFRGKDVRGNWHVGLLAHIGNAWYISNKAGIATAYEVRPETVSQFTGLTDKNGKQIFEGDIIHFQGVSWSGCEEVFWCKSEFQWRLRNRHFSGGSRPLEHDDKEWGEVVGNIHDNPELMEASV